MVVHYAYVRTYVRISKHSVYVSNQSTIDLQLHTYRIVAICRRSSLDAGSRLIAGAMTALQLINAGS
jgi:hypothetical protein